MSAPKLWSWQLSPFAGKVRVAAAFKGVELKLLEIHPIKRPPRLRELNPANRVPVLELDDGVAIRESTPICEWLEDTQPGPSLWPATPDTRGRARGLLRWVDDELSVNFFLAMRKESFGLDEKIDHPDLVANLQHALTRRWKAAEQLLAGTDGPWMMGGDGPTLVDLAATPLAVRLPEWKPELQPDAEAYPRVADWLETLRVRPEAAEVDRRGEPVS